MRWEFIRFLLVGACNTMLSWILFVIFLHLMSYPYAYTLAYAIGIAISYFFNVLFVFKDRISISSLFKFPLVYLLQYAFGIIVMWVLVEKMGVLPEVGMILVIGVTIPITFLVSRKIIKAVQLTDCSAPDQEASHE